MPTRGGLTNAVLIPERMWQFCVMIITSNCHSVKTPTPSAKGERWPNPMQAWLGDEAAAVPIEAVLETGSARDTRPHRHS